MSPLFASIDTAYMPREFVVAVFVTDVFTFVIFTCQFGIG